MPAKKKKIQIDIWNERMLILMREKIADESCTSQKDFLESIGFEPTNLKQVRLGIQGFRISHLVEAAKKYKININWLCGLKDEPMSRHLDSTAIVRLKQAVTDVETEMRG